MRNLLLGIGCSALMACGSAPQPCGPATCLSGCCDATGTCVAGQFSSACGASGSRCVDCGGSQCRAGFCFSPGAPADSGVPVDAGSPSSDAGTSPSDAGTSFDGGVPNDGGTQSCDGGTLAVCNGQCVDTSSDVNNCGGCGQPCFGKEGTLACTNGACTITCNPGYADCGQFGSCDYSLYNSPDTCGSCQTSCSTGQACLNGACTVPSGSPATVYTPSNAISDLAVDSAALYWLDFGPYPTTTQCSVMRLAKGATTPTALATGLASPAFLRQDSANLYWIDTINDTLNSGCPCVYAVSKNGGTPQLLGTSQSPTGLAAAGGNVYWTDFQCASLGNGGCGAAIGSLFTASITGGGVQTVAGSLNEPGALATDGASLYWADGYNQNILAVAAGTTGAPRLVISDTLVSELAVQGTTLFWTDLGGWLWSGPASGGQGTRLIEGPYTTYGRTGIVVDAAHVYWWDLADGSFADDVVMRVAPDGTGFTPLAASQQVTGGAVDSTSFYWINAGNSYEVLSLPR